MANLLPPDIDDILSSDEWKSLTPGERNSAVDDWAVQAKNATDWTPDEINDLDASIDRFRSSAAESVAEQTGRVLKEGGVGGVKSLASLPFAVPRLGYQAGATIGTAANAEVDQMFSGEPDSPERDERISAAIQRDAPDLSRLVTSGIQTVEGAKAYARERNPFSTNDEMFDAATGKLRDDILKRKVPEDPEALYEYLKKQGFQIAKATAALHGGKVEDYVPQEFQGGNDEAIFKEYLNKAMEGKRPEGFVELKDDTLPTEGMVTRNQSRSLITSPENLGLLMKFSATRNPAYFEALRQRLGRSLGSQVASGMVNEIEGRRDGNDRFDDAVKTIFSVGGTFPEAGDEMVQQTQSMAQSPIDMASTFFSFGLGKQALKAAAQRNLLKSASTVAAGVGNEFLEGAASGLQDQALPTDQNLLEEGLMEAVGGGVMQAGGAAVGAAQQGVSYLRDQSIPVAEADEVEAAPLLTPEEQAELAEDEALAQQAEPTLPLAAEALREAPEAVEEEETAEVVEAPTGQSTASVPIMVTRDMTQQLLDRGYTRAQVNRMRPAEAQAILNPPPRVEAQPLPAAVYAPGETIDYNGQPRVVDTFIPSLEDVGGPPASVSFQDDPTTFVPVQSNAQGTIPNDPANSPVTVDAVEAAPQVLAQAGPVETGSEAVATPPSPVVEAPVEGEVVVQGAAPATVAEVIPPPSTAPLTAQELYDRTNRGSSAFASLKDSWDVYAAHETAAGRTPTREAFTQLIRDSSNIGETLLEPPERPQDLSEDERAAMVPQGIGPKASKWTINPASRPVTKGVARVKEWLGEKLSSNIPPIMRSDLEKFQSDVLPAIERAQSLFPGVQLTLLSEGGGFQVGVDTGLLKVDPQRVMRNISRNSTPDQTRSTVEAMLDEEFRHAVSLQLDRTSPEFSRDLQDLWTSLPPEVREASSKIYGRKFTDDFEGRHEFFRQYWQNAEVRSLTEAAMRQDPTLMEKFQKLLDAFISQLRRLQEGAVPEVKPILDRLIAQATQRANELRQNATQTTAQEAVSPPVQDTGIPPVPPVSQETQAPESTEPETTSLKKAVVDPEREARGEEAIPPASTRGWTELEERAHAALEVNPQAGYELLQGLQVNPRLISDYESMVLIFHKARVMSRMKALREQISKEQDGAIKTELIANYEKLLGDLNDIDRKVRSSKSDVARSLNIQKYIKELDNEKYTLEQMLQEYRTRANMGEALTPEQRASVEKNTKAIETAQKAVDEAEEAKEKAEADPVYRKMAQEARKKQRERKKPARDGRKGIVRDKVKGAREWLQENPATPTVEGELGLSAPSLNPRTEALATVGAEYIENGADTLEKFTKSLVKEFGESVRNQAADIYERSKEVVQEAQQEADRAEEKAKEAATPKGVLAAGKERITEKGESSTLDKKLLSDLFDAYILSQGDLTAEQINTLITNDIQDIYPGATESNVRVALTDYGKTKWPSKDALKKQKAEYLRILRLKETLTRIQSGRQGLKSGLQRDKPSAREREIQSEIQEAMKKFKVETTAEDQLASTKKSLTNRLKNQIEDLNRIINGQARPKEARAQVEYDAEINALVKERDELKAFVDNLTGPSAEGLWNKEAQAAAKAMAENYRRKIQQADFKARQRPNYNPTEATKKLQDEALEAKAEFETLKDLSGETQKQQLEAQKTALERQIERVRQQLITGQKPAPGSPKPSNQEIQDLKTTLKNLQESVKILSGRDSESKRAENAAKAIQKSIDNLKRRIAQKDTTPAARRSPVQNEELKRLREERDFQQEIYDALKEAQNPKLLPEEIALQNFGRRIERLRYEADNAINNQEYLEDTTLDPVIGDRLASAKYLRREAERAWNQEMLARRQEQRIPSQKIRDAVFEFFQTLRGIMAGGEFSAFLRQGKFASGRPFAYAKSVPAAWLAFRSPEGLDRIQQEIESRENYKNGAYDKLALVDPNDPSFTKIEEDFQSRWINKIPFIAGTARAYSGFLNALRANAFDALAATQTRRMGPLTADDAARIADIVNNITGRGSLGKFENAGVVLNKVYFSPKFIASRFNLLTGKGLLWGSSPRTRRLVAEEYARMLASTAVYYGLMALFFGDWDDDKGIEIDPRSGDFLKIPVGPNTKIDPLAGLIQLIVLSTRIATGQTKSRDGDIKDLRGEDLGFGARNLGEVLFDFNRSKLAPVPAFILNTMMQESYGNQPYSLVGNEDVNYFNSEAGKMTTPMTYKEIAEAAQDVGVPKAIALAIWMMAGEGVQAFPQKDNDYKSK